MSVAVRRATNLLRPRSAPSVLPSAAASRRYLHKHNKNQIICRASHVNLHPTNQYSTARVAGGLPHDIGGETSAFGSLASTIENPDQLLDWEVQCHSLFAVLAIKGYVTTDGLRRSIESFTPNQYESWGYYEKWAAGMTALLLEGDGGVVTIQELNEALFGTKQQPARSSSNGDAPMFIGGDHVRVRPYRHDHGIEWRRPHIRVPGYIYGVRGVVERVCGTHPDPSFLAFGLDSPIVRLYRVRFRMKDIWPEQHTTEEEEDVIEVEVYEPWLEASVESSGHAFETGGVLFDHSNDGSDCLNSHGDSSSSHPHNHSHHEHSHHDPRPLVEERSARLEGEPRPGKELHSALTKVLFHKGIITQNDIREMSERLVMAGKTLNGASLIAKAWTDPAYEERLLSDATSAASEIDIVTSNPNAPTVLTVVKNTAKVHNLVVCTLCSCYPSGLLGIAPSWYKSREYRSRAVREPRRVLAEFGTFIPEECQIRVHDSTADHRYIVLPRRPEGTMGWDEEQLRGLVSRDCMVGVALPSLRSK